MPRRRPEPPDAEAEAEPEAPDAEAAAPEADAEPPDAEAVDVSEAAEAPAAEEDEEAPAAEAAEPAVEGEEEQVGDPDKYSAGGEVSVGGAGTQSGLEPGEAEKAGEVPTEFRVPPCVPGGLDPGTLADRDKRV